MDREQWEDSTFAEVLFLVIAAVLVMGFVTTCRGDIWGYVGCEPEPCPRMAVTPEGETYYLTLPQEGPRADGYYLEPNKDGQLEWVDVPKTIKGNQEGAHFELAEQVCWCGDTVEILGILERAIGYIDDNEAPKEEINLSEGKPDLAYKEPETAMSNAMDNYERHKGYVFDDIEVIETLKEETKLHNEIKALIQKIKGGTE